MAETLQQFIAQVKAEQTLWALQDSETEDWVVLDSVHFENAETMPLWSSAELAKVHCTEQWQDYQPAQISIADWLEYWVDDLKEDDVVVGLNWQEGDNAECYELELAEFTLALAEVEQL